MKYKIFTPLFLICSISIHSQGLLFMPKTSNADFDNQIEIQKIMNRTSTYSVTPIDIDFELLTLQQNLTFVIDDNSYTLSPISIEARGINNFTATYRSDNKLNTMVLSVYGNNFKGYLFLENGVWSIETTDNNQYVLVGIDQSTFPNEKDIKHKKKISKANDQINDSVSGVKMVEMIPHPIISVLVLYTNDVRSSYSNVVNEIFIAEGMANAAFDNSDIDCKLKVVYIGPTDYNELYPYNSSNFDEDLNRFATRNDGYMDEVFGLRETYSADICVLIRKDDTYCGVARDIGAIADSAFCMVSYDCASSYLSFAHEIGHLVGCRHDLHVDTLADPNGYMFPYLYGHGYISTGKTWRTIMSYGNGCHRCERIPYWSNPEIEPYGGEHAGDETYCNNARVWKENAEIVSYFRSAPYEDIYADSSDVINADYAHMFSYYDIITSGTNVTINANSKVTFQSGNEIHLMPGFHAQNGSYFHAYILNYDSAATYYTYNPLSAPHKHNIDNDITRTNTLKMHVSANPINENSNLKVELDRDYENFNIDVLDLFGRIIKNITSAAFIPAGDYIYPIDNEELSKGIMFITASSNNQILNTIKISKL